MRHTEDQSKYVVLLSGGLDSATNLLWAASKGHVVAAVFVNYGQKVLKQERASASKLAQHVGAEFVELDLSWIKRFSNSALTSADQSAPVGAQVNLHDAKTSQDTARAVWVPNRNGIMIHAAAVVAESLGAEALVVGFNREEAQTFPDNSKAYLSQESLALKFSTANQLRLECFTIDMDKPQIFLKAAELKLPFSWIWSCYLARDQWCLECESCLRLLNAAKSCGFKMTEDREFLCS